MIKYRSLDYDRRVNIDVVLVNGNDLLEKSGEVWIKAIDDSKNTCSEFVRNLFDYDDIKNVYLSNLTRCIDALYYAILKIKNHKGESFVSIEDLDKFGRVEVSVIEEGPRYDGGYVELEDDLNNNEEISIEGILKGCGNDIDGMVEMIASEEESDGTGMFMYGYSKPKFIVNENKRIELYVHWKDISVVVPSWFNGELHIVGEKKTTGHGDVHIYNSQGDKKLYKLTTSDNFNGKVTFYNVVKKEEKK